MWMVVGDGIDLLELGERRHALPGIQSAYIGWRTLILLVSTRFSLTIIGRQRTISREGFLSSSLPHSMIRRTFLITSLKVIVPAKVSKRNNDLKRNDRMPYRYRV